MAVLKKLNLNYRVRASTLMETLVATVLIVAVFMIASMILNNLFSNTTKHNTRNIDAYLNELEYIFKNDKLSVPYYDDFKVWEISIEKANRSNKDLITISAVNTKTNKIIRREIIEE